MKISIKMNDITDTVFNVIQQMNDDMCPVFASDCADNVEKELVKIMRNKIRETGKCSDCIHYIDSEARCGLRDPRRICDFSPKEQDLVDKELADRIYKSMAH